MSKIIRETALSLAVVTGLFVFVSKADERYSHESAPPQAVAVGYRNLVFDTAVFNHSTVDTANNQAPGFQWYLWAPYYGPPANPAKIVLNGDGSVTFMGDKENASLATASYTGTPGGFVGSTFGGGGYFEATLRIQSARCHKKQFCRLAIVLVDGPRTSDVGPRAELARSGTRL